MSFCVLARGAPVHGSLTGILAKHCISCPQVFDGQNMPLGPIIQWIIAIVNQAKGKTF